MTALAHLDAELEERQFPRLKPATVDDVRRLCRHPEAGQQILYERLLLGCVALDEYESDNRWELFEFLLIAYRCCQDALDAARRQIIDTESERQRTDLERREERRRLTSINRQSIAAHLEHESARPVADNEQPQQHTAHIGKAKG